MRSGDGIIIMRALRLRNVGRRDPERKLLNGILGDSDQSAVVARALEDRYSVQLMKFTETEPSVGDDGAFVNFLKWLLENQDSVIAFIKTIMALFAEDGT